MSTDLNYKGEIVIVDDDPANLGLLFEVLKAQQYVVRVANSGRLALTVINSSPPDLILLDVNMPNMNGYELCERIKADPNTSEIPVIFISASNEAIDKVKAFRVGGIDYVAKPFQMEEVLARVESQLKIARLSHQLQMQMLRYQLDPHFLFNALNSVRTLIAVDSETAEEMIMQLADYLRYLLVSRNKLEVSVSEELEAAQNYLAIEQVRFKGKLIVKTNVDSRVENYLIPASLLQPLLENAIKYGMKSNPKPLEITISIELKNDKLCLKISNTGKWMAPRENASNSTGLGVGLENIRQRLRQRYPARHNFTISNDEDSINVLIEIPISEN
ncbi:MAG: two-component hybrid sensor and regulator [bacterium]|nr:MAG: two-component hybrid sensor and regulator [bacterium]